MTHEQLAELGFKRSMTERGSFLGEDADTADDEEEGSPGRGSRPSGSDPAPERQPADEEPPHPREDRFRAFLGIVIGVVAGAALWLCLIELIRALR